MSRFKKTNAIAGQNKAHSILRGAGMFLDDLANSNLIDPKKVGTKPFKPYNGRGVNEPIEVIEISSKSRRPYLKLRFYEQQMYQEVFLVTSPANFPNIMDKVIKYCEKYPR